jgi:DNA polymerase V
MDIQPPLLQPIFSSLRVPYIEFPRPQAGFASPAADYTETTLDLHDLLVENPTATFYLRVQGDSMIDAHIFDGDVLVVDRSRKPGRGKIVIASIQDGEHLLVKQFSIVDGRPALLSRNAARAKDYPPILFSDDTPAEIWGVVVGTVRKL